MDRARPCGFRSRCGILVLSSCTACRRRSALHARKSIHDAHCQMSIGRITPGAAINDYRPLVRMYAQIILPEYSATVSGMTAPHEDGSEVDQTTSPFRYFASEIPR